MGKTYHIRDPVKFFVHILQTADDTVKERYQHTPIRAAHHGEG
jgi:hypothetical protein